MIGRQIGGYRIESVIGRGGMGIVYLADQVRLERKVALKVISPELAHDVGFRSRFERESRVAASIDHPNVVPVYEAGELDGLLYLAMRYVPGTDLKAAVSAPLDPRRAADIVGQIGGALDAAHARGLVHRDVKPGNILLEPTGGGGERAYLSDFGLTKRLSSASGITETGFVVGTLDYIAPEQVQGAAIDARTDVYALACVLFHALTGRVPYERENDMAKMYAHANHEAPSVLEAAPHLPHAVEDVIKRGMAKDPAGRYASAGDLGRAAQAAVEGHAATLIERSVATGPAAPGQSTLAVTPPPPAAPSGPPTAETQPLPSQAPPPPRMPVPPPHAHAPPPMAPLPASASRSQTPLIAALVALVALAGVAVALLATGTIGGGDDEADKPVAGTVERETETTTVERKTERPRDTDTEPDTPTRESGSPPTFEPFTSEEASFKTVMPTGEGWSEPDVTSMSGGAIIRTTVTGPDGHEVIIDHTPNEAATFEPSDRCVESDHPNVQYSAHCEFTGGSLAPCQRARCIDDLLNANVDGPGWAVVVGGGDYATTKLISEEVVSNFTPLG